MSSWRARRHDALMPRDTDLKTSAYDLRRAAGGLQAHASAGGAVSDLEVTLAHVEEALDRLAVALLKMADAVSDWCADDGRESRDDILPPEARALRFHLQAAAAGLRVPQDGSTSSRIWTRRLLEVCQPGAATVTGAAAETA